MFSHPYSENHGQKVFNTINLDESTQNGSTGRQIITTEDTSSQLVVTTTAAAGKANQNRLSLNSNLNAKKQQQSNSLT